MAKILKRDLSKEAFCENRGKYSFGEIETKSEISNSLTIYSIVTETRAFYPENMIPARHRISLTRLDSFPHFLRKMKQSKPVQKEW